MNIALSQRYVCPVPFALSTAPIEEPARTTQNILYGSDYCVLANLGRKGEEVMSDPCNLAALVQDLFGESPSQSPNPGRYRSSGRCVSVVVGEGAESLAHPWVAASEKNGFQSQVLVLSVGQAKNVLTAARLIVLVGTFSRLDATVQELQKAAPRALIVVHGSTVDAEDARALGCAHLRANVDADAFLRWFRRQLYASNSSVTVPMPEAYLDTTQGTLRVSDRIFALQPREVELLQIIASYGEAFCTTQRLCEELLGAATPRERRLVWQHLYRLRGKLKPVGGLVTSVQGKGYRLVGQLKVVHVVGGGDADAGARGERETHK